MIYSIVIIFLLFLFLYDIYIVIILFTLYIYLYISKEEQWWSNNLLMLKNNHVKIFIKQNIFFFYNNEYNFQYIINQNHNKSKWSIKKIDYIIMNIIKEKDKYIWRSNWKIEINFRRGKRKKKLVPFKNELY